ncbi:MAG: MBL fold metallo-hydrolase [Turicibacter sp.]
MKIYPLVLGPVQTTCYIISNGPKALVVDPAANAQQIIKHLKNNKLKLEGILITHGHFDHIGAVNELGAHFDVPVFAHKKEKEYFDKPHVNLSTMMHENLVLNDTLDFQFLNDFETVALIDLEFKVFHVPGHTSGSLCFYCESEQVVFTGDTLFNGSIGRTDFVHGNEAQLVKGIKEKILTLPNTTLVYPGHGECTTVEDEKKHNVFLNR